jgi:hypothetical protein
MPPRLTMDFPAAAHKVISSPTTKSPSTPDTFLVTSLNSSHKGCKRLSIERSPIVAAPPVQRKPRVPVYMAKEKVIPVKLKPLFLVDKLNSQEQQKRKSNGTSLADKANETKTVATQALVRPIKGKENGQPGKMSTTQLSTSKSAFSKSSKPPVRVAHVPTVAHRATLEASRPIPRHARSSFTTRPSPSLRSSAPNVQFHTPCPVPPIRSREKPAGVNPSSKSQSKSHFFTPPTIQTAKTAVMMLPPSDVRKPSFSCALKKGRGRFGSSMGHMEVESSPSPAEREKDVGDIVPLLSTVSKADSPSLKCPRLATKPHHCRDASGKIKAPPVMKNAIAMFEEPWAAFNHANGERVEELKQVTSSETVLDNPKRSAPEEANLFKFRVCLAPHLASNSGGSEMNNAKKGKASSMMDELKTVLTKRDAKLRIGNESNKVGATVSMTSRRSVISLPSNIDQPQFSQPTQTVFLAKTGAHVGSIIPFKDNPLPNAMTFGLSEDTIDFVSTAFGLRRVRNLFIPPLSDDAPLPSRDALIQLELKNLRAQKKVGVLGGEINGVK